MPTSSFSAPPTGPAVDETVFREIPQRQVDSVAHALASAQKALLQRQYSDGYWVGELQGDSILESEYILTKFILTQDDDPELPLIANYLRRLQQPDGGWNMYPGGKADLSGTVKAYFALKLRGDSPDAPHMNSVRELIWRLGGAEKRKQRQRSHYPET